MSDESNLSAISPGFWAYNGKSFIFDLRCSKLFNFDEQEQPSLQQFIAAMPSESVYFLENIFSSRLYGDTLLLNINLNAGAKNERKVFLQGSIINRDQEGTALYAIGYAIEVKNFYSTPVLHDIVDTGVWEWNVITGKVTFSKSYYEMLGYTYPDDDFAGSFQQWSDIVHPDDNDSVEFQRQLGQSPEFGDRFECSIRLRHKDGHYILTLGKGIVTQRDENGRAVHIVGTNTNIESIKQNYDKQLNKLYIDTLTGAYNREFFNAKVSELLLESSIFPLALIYVDVSGLKMINDLMSHSYGDMIIRDAVKIMRVVISREKYIIRIGGDEFLILIPTCMQGQAQEYISSIKKYCSTYNQTAKVPVILACGEAVISSEQTTDINEFIIQADNKMHEDKRRSQKEDYRLLVQRIEEATHSKLNAYQDTRLLPKEDLEPGH